MLELRQRPTIPRFPFRGNELEDCVLYANLADEKSRISPFYSQDPNHHLLTVTGAIWTPPTGYVFDGNDYLSVTTTALNFTTSNFSAFVWVKSSNLTTQNNLLTRGLYQADGWYMAVSSTGVLSFVTNQALASQISSSANSSIVTDTWYLLGFTRGGAVGKVWRNAVDVTTSSGTHINPLTSARTCKIGVYDNLTLFLIGTMGEVLVYNRDLSVGEILGIYEKTKWRYKS